MKQAFLGTMALAMSLNSFGQTGAQEKSAPAKSEELTRNNVYVDLGLPLGSIIPGASATYDYRVSRHFGVGGGAHFYTFYYGDDSKGKDILRAVPGLFADIRTFARVKRSELVFFANLGVDIYHADRTNNEAPHDNGVCTALGIAYAHPISGIAKQFYISLKAQTDSYSSDDFYQGRSIIRPCWMGSRYYQ